MSRLLSSLLFVLALASTALADQVVKVNVGDLNVRSGPGLTYSVVGQVQYGEQYVVAGSSGSWKKIWYGPGTAWVYSAYVVPVVATHEKVTATSLNVRSGPGTAFPIVGQAPEGSVWVVLGASGAWRQVWYKSEKRWMHGAYLAPTQPAVEMVFIQWADIHCGAYDYANTFRKSWVLKLNALPGKAWPASMGGTVGPISHVLALGDITEKGLASEWNDGDSWIGDDYISLRNLLNYPSYECMGNHDTWNSGAKAGIVAFHGSTYYSFNKGGVHFVALDEYVYGSSMAAKPDLVPAELQWLENDLNTVQKGVTPVVLFMHSPCKPSLGVWWTTIGSSNEQLKTLLTGHKVLLLLHGHWHQTMKNTWNGWDLIGCGNASNPQYQGATKTTTVNVIRIKGNECWVVPFKLTTGEFLEPILHKTF